jgi:hypothetical protein
MQAKLSKNTQLRKKKPRLKVSQIVILTPPMKQGALDENYGKIWRRTTARTVACALHAPVMRLRVGFMRRRKLARVGAWKLR